MKTVDIAKELMKYETISPIEKPRVFQFLKGLLEKHGISAEVREIEGVYNLTAETGNRNSGDSICLNGHLDVVEPEGEWSVTRPFKPKIEDQKLYGRGATDMKGEAAALIKAFIELHEDEGFNGHCTLMLVGDEEIGGYRGTEPLVDEHYRKHEGFDYAIIGEPTDLNIQVGTRGVLWLNVLLEGEGVHASRAHIARINVMEELPKALNRLNNLELTFNNQGDLPDPSNEVTKIKSTETYNSVPGQVEIGMDMRILPSQNVDRITEDVEKALNDLDCGVKVEIEDDLGGAFQLEDEEFKQTAKKVLDELRQDEAEYITEGGASDGRFFSERGTPFIELGLNQKSAHAENEYCSIKNLEKLEESFYRISKRLVG